MDTDMVEHPMPSSFQGDGSLPTNGKISPSHTALNGCAWMATYISESSTLWPESIRSNYALLEKITAAVSKVSGNDALLSRLYLGLLVHENLTWTSFERALTNLPSKDELYANAFASILQLDGQRGTLARKTLSWLALAKRPLHPAELRYIFFMDDSSQAQGNNHQSDVNDILGLYNGLVSADYTEGWNASTPEFTVLEDILSCFASYYRTGIFLDEENSLDSMFAQRCEYPLLGYAVQFWNEHVADCQRTDWYRTKGVLEWAISSNTLQLISKRTYCEPQWYTPTCTWPAATYGALHEAAGANLSSLFAALPQGCSNIDFKDDWGRTPFMIAARARHQQLSKYLIEQHNVDVNASDNSGRQALCEAARCGHTAMIRLLFQTGKVRTTNKSRSDWRCPVTKTPSPLADFRTPLARAAEGGHLPAVELLLAVSSTEPDSVDLYGYTPLGLAAKGGHLKVIARLLKTGKVDVNMQNRAGESPLLLAVKSGLSLPVETLLLANADVNLADTSDRTPLLWAIRIGNFSAITQLIATSRCNVSAADRSGLTALHYAAAVGRVVALPSLRQYHIDTESKDMNGETPLVWAVRARQLGSVRELLRLARSSNIGDSQVSKHFLEWLLSKDEDDESVLNILTEILLKSKKEAVDEPLPLQTGIGDVRQLWAGVVAVSWFPRELVY